MLPFRAQREPLVHPGAIEHQIADLTMTASADVTLVQLQAKLAQNDQWLPIDGDPGLTLGRLMSFNSTGPMRLGFGGWRDLALLIQFRPNRSGLITVGARTMKNVAGYDVTKFLVGQRNLFGQPVTISTRTYKRPAGALIAQFAVDANLIGKLMPSSVRPHWAMVRGQQISCGYFGDEKAMNYFENVLAEYKPKIERVSREAEIEFRINHWSRRSQPVVFRASVPPANVIEILNLLKLPDSSGDLSFGIVVGSCDLAERQHVREVIRAKGTVLFEDESPLLDIAGPQRELLERLAAAF